MRTTDFVAQDSSLAEHVHIPKVYPEYSIKCVLTAEWISGVCLSDRQGILKLMGDSSTALPSKWMTPLGSPILSSDADSLCPLEGGMK